VPYRKVTPSCDRLSKHISCRDLRWLGDNIICFRQRFRLSVRAVLHDLRDHAGPDEGNEPIELDRHRGEDSASPPPMPLLPKLRCLD
jgi:hypothetical protein